MTAIEMVWTQLKACADDYAARGERLGTLHAQATVVKLMQAAYVSPWPETHVIEFYANELVTMVDERMRDGSPSGTRAV